VLVHRNVDASTNEEIKGIIAGGLAGDQTARSRAGSVEISVKIAVSAAEQRLGKWFEMRNAEFYDRTNVIGEQIALGRYGARTVAVRGRDSKVVGITAIALKLTLDSDQLGEVIRNSSTTSVQGEGWDDVVILRICVNVRIINRTLNFVVVLRNRRTSKEQSDSENEHTSSFHTGLL